MCKSPLRCVFLMYAIMFTMNEHTYDVSFSSFRPGSFKISWKTVTEEKTRKTSAFQMVMVWKTHYWLMCIHLWLELGSIVVCEVSSYSDKEQLVGQIHFRIHASCLASCSLHGYTWMLQRTLITSSYVGRTYGLLQLMHMYVTLITPNDGWSESSVAANIVRQMLSRLHHQGDISA